MCFYFIGIGVGTVDTTFPSRILSYLRVSSFPKVVMIFQEEFYYYNGIIAKENIKGFISSQLPKYHVQAVSFCFLIVL